MNNLSFGGPWTQEKLDILRRYLDVYTTALKNRPFRLIYLPSRQLSLLGDSRQERTGGSDRIATLYRARLESVFAKVAPSDREFRNSKNAPMFRLFFAASNPTGATIAVRIAKHILDHW